MTERQEIHCHECNQYVQFDIDIELDGNHVLNCPVCGHEHCRVVENGKITGDRWDHRNRHPVVYVPTSTITTSTASTYATYSSTATSATGGYFIYGSWMNTATS